MFSSMQTKVSEWAVSWATQIRSTYLHPICLNKSTFTKN